MEHTNFTEGYWDNEPDDVQKVDYSWLTPKSLMTVAKSHKLSDKTIKLWADTHHKDVRLEGYGRMKDMDLGVCFMTPDRDYYMYSFKTNRFYFFKHTRDAVANINSPIMGTRVVEAIKREGVETLAELKKTLSHYRDAHQF